MISYRVIQETKNNKWRHRRYFSKWVWDTSQVNVNGGAIAIGHPIGASGCRISVTLLREMPRRDAKKDIASRCIGGSMGVALTVER